MNIGIPTTYLGRNYRSRLEAHWAAFFDLVGWRYEYEPYDLNGWIPDFVLYGHRAASSPDEPTVEGADILVEVKPYGTLTEFDTGKLLRAVQGTEKQDCEILLLGSSIWPNGNWGYVGWIRDTIMNPYGIDYFDEADFTSLGGLGFCSREGAFQNRITGEWDGDNRGSMKFGQIRRLWNEAGNTVQWKAVLV